MSRGVFWLVLMCWPLVIAGCGRIQDAVHFADAATQAQNRNARIAALDGAAFASMPVTGTVVYQGHTSVTYQSSGATVSLLGQTVLMADFAAGTVTGRADGFFGGTDIDDVQNYDGALTMDGDIGLRRPNSLDATVAGELTAGDQLLSVQGPLLGQFRGDGAQAITAFATPDLQGFLNGVVANVRLQVAAER